MFRLIFFSSGPYICEGVKSPLEGTSPSAQQQHTWHGLLWGSTTNSSPAPYVHTSWCLKSPPRCPLHRKFCVMGSVVGGTPRGVNKAQVWWWKIKKENKMSHASPFDTGNRRWSSPKQRRKVKIQKPEVGWGKERQCSPLSLYVSCTRETLKTTVCV